MALSARELVLVLRARDEASRIVRQVGSSVRTLGDDGVVAADKLQGLGTALLTGGTLLTGAGAVGVGFFDGAVQGATDYSKAAALTLTQTGDVATSLEELKRIGVDVSRDIPIAMGDIQGSLFDIFSTIDTTVPGAEAAVRDFARAAVAGDAEISTVSRTTLAALNAWQLPVEDTTRLLDTQFRLVELGAGTYQEFAQTMGLAIPTSVAAGQSFDTLSGSLAFLTRSGLTTNRAVTSTARAFELLTQPNVVKNLEDIGVSVKDSEGNFRQMDDIITQLAENQGWAQMTDPERKEAFKEIFGTGSIQARRFFDVAIPNYKQFNDLTEEMRSSQGAMSRAYDIMFEQPASQVQLLKNEYEGIKQEIGEQLLPMKIRLMEVILQLFDAWNNLSPETRQMIVQFAAIAAAVAAVVGPIIAFVGSLLLFVGIVAPLVGGVGALAAAFGWVLLAIAAVVAIGYVLITHWDTIKETAQSLWDTVVSAFESARDTIVPIVEELWAKFMEFWDWFMETYGPGLSELWETISTEFSNLKDEFFETIDAIKENFEQFVEGLKIIWETISPVVMAVLSVVAGIITDFIDFVTAAWDVWGDSIVTILGAAWDQVVNIITTAITIVSNIIQFIMNVIQGDWSAAWQNVKNIFQAVGNFLSRTARNFTTILLAILRGLWNSIVAIFTSLGRSMWSLMLGAWNSVNRQVSNGMSRVMSNIRRLPGQILGVFRNAGSILWGAGRRILQGLIDGVSSKVQSLKNKFASVTNLIPSWKGPEDVDRKLLINSGVAIMGGLEVGLEKGWGDVQRYLAGLTHADNFMAPLSIGPDPNAQLLNALGTQAQMPHQGEKVGIKVEGDLVIGDADAVDDLDWWTQKEVSGI